jgi:hypothetical protein
VSYPDQVPARGRPAAVRLAASVLVLMAVAALAYAVAALATLGGTVDRFRAAADTTAHSGEAAGLVTLLRVVVGLSAALTVLVGAVLVGLAFGLLAGRAGARTTTWVVAGLGLVLGCCGLTTLAGQRALPLRLDAGDRGAVELLGLLSDAYPSWWIPVNAALSVGQVVGYLVVAVLLALPAANAWFRRPRRAPAPVGPPPAGLPHPPR